MKKSLLKLILIMMLVFTLLLTGCAVENPNPSPPPGKPTPTPTPTLPANPTNPTIDKDDRLATYFGITFPTEELEVSFKLDSSSETGLDYEEKSFFVKVDLENSLANGDYISISADVKGESFEGKPITSGISKGYTSAKDQVKSGNWFEIKARHAGTYYVTYNIEVRTQVRNFGVSKVEQKRETFQVSKEYVIKKADAIVRTNSDLRIIDRTNLSFVPSAKAVKGFSSSEKDITKLLLEDIKKTSSITLEVEIPKFSYDLANVYDMLVIAKKNTNQVPLEDAVASNFNLSYDTGQYHILSISDEIKVDNLYRQLSGEYDSSYFSQWQVALNSYNALSESAKFYFDIYPEYKDHYDKDFNDSNIRILSTKRDSLKKFQFDQTRVDKVISLDALMDKYNRSLTKRDEVATEILLYLTGLKNEEVYLTSLKITPFYNGQNNSVKRVYDSDLLYVMKNSSHVTIEPKSSYTDYVLVGVARVRGLTKATVATDNLFVGTFPTHLNGSQVPYQELVNSSIFGLETALTTYHATIKFLTDRMGGKTLDSMQRGIQGLLITTLPNFKNAENGESIEVIVSALESITSNENNLRNNIFAALERTKDLYKAAYASLLEFQKTDEVKKDYNSQLKLCESFIHRYNLFMSVLSHKPLSPYVLDELPTKEKMEKLLGYDFETLIGNSVKPTVDIWGSATDGDKNNAAHALMTAPMFYVDTLAADYRNWVELILTYETLVSDKISLLESEIVKNHGLDLFYALTKEQKGSFNEKGDYLKLSTSGFKSKIEWYSHIFIHGFENANAELAGTEEEIPWHKLTIQNGENYISQAVDTVVTKLNRLLKDEAEFVEDNLEKFGDEWDWGNLTV